MREEIHHGGRPGQDIGFEAFDPEAGRRARHLFEKGRPHTPLPPGVGHRQRELRPRHSIRGRLEAMETTEAHDLFVSGTLGRHEAKVAVEVVTLKPRWKLSGQKLPVFGADRAKAQGLAVF
jgi:hypothetical protein